MEAKNRSSSDTASESWDKGLTCWRTASGPQCLRVETTKEVHLFAYGYFQHARFFQDGNKEVVQIQFQDRITVIKGKGLEPLCVALERLAVECIRISPEKYEEILKGNGFIEDIEIKKAGEPRPPERDSHLQQ
jgi:hypothetical protein